MIVFTTRRLQVRIAEPRDADMYLELWKEPRVMANVGFPGGLPITREQIVERLERGGESEFERLLVMERLSDGEVLGECYLHVPNEEGVAGTDVKLLPRNWGHRYGAEVKQGLVDYLFRHTGCQAVRGTPRVGNEASIRMQESVGAVRVRLDGEYWLYHVYREAWEARRGSDEASVDAP